MQNLNLLLQFGLPVGLILFAYLIGSFIERRHFRSIRAREDALYGYPVTNLEGLPENWQVGRADLVTGNVVVSLDYFKRIVAGLRGLVGGRVRTYEPLLDRGRREAVLRMAESARSHGYDAVVNVRLKTSRLANSRGGGEGTAGVELLAYGTALKLDRR